MQSQSVLSFKPFQLERSQDNNLPSYIKGAALFDKVDSEEGLWVFNALSSEYSILQLNTKKTRTSGTSLIKTLIQEIG